MRAAFSRFANAAAKAQGHWLAFILALALIVVWGAWGPFAHYSNTWELVINTGTTIITFLGLFLVQHAANVSDAAMHLKLDAIIEAIQPADNAIINAEDEP